MKISGKIAFAGMVCALSVVCMLMTIVPTMEIGLPALAGVLLVFPVIELGIKYGFLCYGATAVIALLLVPSLEAKILFLLFFGYYPVVKALIERIKSVVLQWTVKLLLFNVSVCVAYFLLLKVFAAVVAEDFVMFGAYLPAVLLLAGNAVFLLYDVALTRIITVYLRFWQPCLRKMFRF